jgi:hypothetical protein
MQGRAEALDLGLFRHIESQTTDSDKRALLALQNVCRDRFGAYSYLEIGSHLGGSLQPFVVDPLCEAIVSIDPRPQVQDDERGPSPGYEYPDNSTERMLELLRQVPGADLTKLRTIEAGTEAIAPAEVEERPRFCFIDGEHTNASAFRDACFCAAVVARPALILFHDRHAVASGIARFLFCVPGFAYPLRDYMLVVELGGVTAFRSPHVSELRIRPGEWSLANRLRVAPRITGANGLVDALRARAAIRTRLRQAATRSRSRLPRA